MRTVKWFFDDLTRIGFLVSLIPAGLIAGTCMVDYWCTRLIIFLLFTGLSLLVGIASDWSLHLILGSWVGYIMTGCLLIVLAGYMLTTVTVVIPVRERWGEHLYWQKKRRTR